MLDNKNQKIKKFAKTPIQVITIENYKKDTHATVSPIEVKKMHFEVSDIPNAMKSKHMKWYTASALMNHWFNNGNHGWTNEQKTDFNTIDALKLKSSEYNDSIVTMKWAMQFGQVKDNINTLIASVNEQNGTLNQLLRRLKRKGWKKGIVMRLEATADVRVFEDTNQVQILPIGDISDRLDEYYGAFGESTLKVGITGFTTKDNNFLIERFGIYLKDTYDFTDEFIPQFLGYWTKEKCLSKIQSANLLWSYGAKAVWNSDFMKYRSKNHKGGDFIVFSDIHWIYTEKDTILDLKLATEFKKYV